MAETERLVDFVIVGAGTAGCVLARRLSEDPDVSVVLLEAGGMDTNPAIYDIGLAPMFSLWAPQGAENWGYATTAQPGLGGRSIDVARGKVFGGSSAVNAMIYARGNRRDYDAWHAAGNDGWSYDDVLPSFKTSETYHGPPSAYHGDSGPLSVIDHRDPSEASHAFVAAAAELGHDATYNDFNAERQEGGAGFYQATRSPDGVRVTAASAFVRPVLSRPNLRLMTGARATRVTIDGRRATGVEYIGTDGRTALLRADREVIVCAGAYETPKLLMLSGVGAAGHLGDHGIPVVQDLPGVGRGLQDHMLLGVGYAASRPFPPPEMLAQAGLFTWTDRADREASPDLQYFFGPVQFISQEYLTDGPGFTFAPILAQPRSRGTVTLASGDAEVNARVDAQYLSDDADLAVFEYGIRYARELVATSAFHGLAGRELAPGADVTSSADLRDYIRKSAGTVWHPTSSCRMGSDPLAVVDDRLRVLGIDALRIADASVMPRIPNANPNAAVMMIAEKAADLIRGGPSVAPRAAIAAALG
jgi:choline dehydrogenase